MTRLTKDLLTVSIVSAMAVCVLLTGVSGAFADARELDEIRSAIRARGARWHADETSVSKLSIKERKMRLGNKEEVDLAPLAEGAGEMVPLATVEGLAASLDWRNVGGLSYVSPVKNQGGCGSCWAFAVTAALESQAMIGTGGTQVDLSEQILVSCSGAGSCSGGYPTTASTYIRDKGLPVEGCFPYTATNNSCANACADWQTGQATLYKVKGWRTATSSAYPQRVQDIKNALYTYGPVLATFYVYNDFFSYSGGVYSYTTGAYAGAHAVLIVGYDDNYQAFIVKNSWGSGWGMSGYFMVAYTEVGGTSSFGYSALAYDGFGDAPVNYTLAVSKTGTGTGTTSNSPSGTSFAPGTVVSVTATPGANSTFAGWTGCDSTSGNTCTVTMTANKSVAAGFTLVPVCTYALSATGKTFKAAGGGGSFTVSTQSGCSWTASEASAWVTITSGSSGNGSGTVVYTVDQNTGAARTASISAGGRNYKVSQQRGR